MLLSLLSATAYLSAAAWRLQRQGGALTGTDYQLISISTIAVSLHAALLYQRLWLPQGFNLGFFDAASLIAWIMALLLLLILPRRPIASLTLVLFPLAALAIGLESLFHNNRILISNAPPGVTLHILTSLLAYSLLSIAALQSLFLFIQDKQLRRRRPGWVMQQLPPLQVMEQLLFQILTAGVILLTLSLLSGLIFLENILAQHLTHKTVFSIAAWSIFVILLWGRSHYGWRGRKAVRWTLMGFMLLMLAYFGSKLVLELLLGKHWQL